MYKYVYISALHYLDSKLGPDSLHQASTEPAQNLKASQVQDKKGVVK